jgi:uncharacterized NAD(P)/FAD-binding protein YdhS
LILKEVVIIGDGFAAAVMATHLLRSGVVSTSIAIVGPGELGKGNAYGCDSQFFRLNVREDLPIIFSDDPLHFSGWAQEHINDPQAKTEAGCFYRRQDFGRYVSGLIKRESNSSQPEQIKARVLGISGTEASWNLELDNQSVLSAQHIIIATGNPPPTWPCEVSCPKTAKPPAELIENPWTGSALEVINPQENIILLGGGLTALDVINTLFERKHLGMIYVISPRAVLPPAQTNWQRKVQPNWPKNLTPAKMIRFMRNYLPSASTASPEWQSAWEELRPNINTIWQQFSSYQKRSLFKRLGWLWNLYRFRASPQTIAAYEELKAKNQIRFKLGRAKKILCSQSQVRVLLANGAEVKGDRIINCTGVASDPLLRKLIKDQLAILDPLGSGIAVDESWRVLHAPDKRWNTLWMIGPATMGSLGDVIAASAIAKQAEQLAAQISSGRLLNNI